MTPEGEEDLNKTLKIVADKSLHVEGKDASSGKKAQNSKTVTK